ncbi:RNA-splicing ligase RtcB, partial [Candidatus Woesearchaeota archaeon CG_4_10_14_0_8_um_filter_47_5]
MAYDVEQKNEYMYEVKKQGNMHVPLRIYASKKIMEQLKGDNAIQQGINVACMPGIIGQSIMCPDAHQGYGFPIGGVAAFDAATGIITPGGIGFDINCGVRLLASELDRKDVEPKIVALVDRLFANVPCGVGESSDFLRLSPEELDRVLELGTEWAVKQGIGNEEDRARCEQQGRIESADASKVTPRAKKRGRTQLGTLGAGNHFLEVQYVDEIYDEETARVFGITRKGQIMAMIHCGS